MVVSKRPAIRFSLQSLLIAIALIACLLGILLARDWANAPVQNTIPRPPKVEPSNGVKLIGRLTASRS
jgi:hypothetical protein